MVWVGSEQGDAVLSQRLVIDGQQRLTTCLLLILALRDHLKQSGASVATGDSPDALQNQYLVNPYVDRVELKSKLQLRRLDNAWLQHLLLDAPIPHDKQSQVPRNLGYLRQLIAGEDGARVIKGIRRLMIVSVSLSPGQDIPQLIFESLNSTGMQLAQADLVRNYVLMGHSEQLQTDWYLKYWQPLEAAFGVNYRAFFDGFLRDFLTLELRPAKPFKLENVYVEFKRWYPAYLSRTENHIQALIDCSAWRDSAAISAASQLDPTSHQPLRSVSLDCDSWWTWLQRLELQRVSRPHCLRHFRSPCLH